jgi:large conductance mechanosensitive channel
MKSSTFLKDFKAFAMKGNLIDMAVGVVIGGAFGKIVSSLVADVIMPLVGLLVGGVDFTSLNWTLKEATEDAEAVTLNYGTFIQNVFDFLIIAFSIFVFLRIIFNLSKKKRCFSLRLEIC